jgi:type I restriction enzyme R subunit
LAPQPEQHARENIDRLLEAAGWHVCDADKANIHAARGVAIREFPLPGYGFADYLLYIDGKAAGVIEAKKEGVTLTGVETQSDKYTQGLPAGLPRWSNPLPFAYQSTGVETRFTNGLDPNPRSRAVFALHKPELLADWLAFLPSPASGRGAGGEGGGDGKFTEEQWKWLEMIRDHIAANLGIEPDDFNYAPFVQAGGLGKVHQLFGDDLPSVVEELNAVLVA